MGKFQENDNEEFVALDSTRLRMVGIAVIIKKCNIYKVQKTFPMCFELEIAQIKMKLNNQQNQHKKRQLIIKYNLYKTVLIHLRRPV